MQHHLTYFFAVSLGRIATTQITAQGPIDGYLKGRGKLDIALSISQNKATTFYGGSSDTSYAVPYRGNLLSLFAEYGITDDLDVVATLPYVFTADQSGLQDGSLHLKWRPYQLKTDRRGRVDFLAALGASAPLSDYAPLAAGALGQRAVVIQPRFVAQWNTAKGPFFNFTAGYNHRLDKLNATDVATIQATRPGYNPEAPRPYTTLLLKAGIPAARYYLDAWVEHQRTSGGTDYAPNQPDLPQAYGITYTQIGGTAYYSERGRTGVYLSTGYILSGRNTSNVFRITAGVVVKADTKKRKKAE